MRYAQTHLQSTAASQMKSFKVNDVLLNKYLSLFFSVMFVRMGDKGKLSFYTLWICASFETLSK